MNKKRVGWGIFAAILVIAGISDRINYEANAMERLHKQAGITTQCKQVEDNLIACNLGGTVSAWQKTESGWKALNGSAAGIVNRIADLSNDDLRNLPDVYWERGPTEIPESVLNAFKS